LQLSGFFSFFLSVGQFVFIFGELYQEQTSLNKTDAGIHKGYYMFSAIIASNSHSFYKKVNAQERKEIDYVFRNAMSIKC